MSGIFGALNHARLPRHWTKAASVVVVKYHCKSEAYMMTESIFTLVLLLQRFRGQIAGQRRLGIDLGLGSASISEASNVQQRSKTAAYSPAVKQSVIQSQTP